MADLCMACGSPACPGRAGIDYCPRWQEAEARRARDEYLTTRPRTPCCWWNHDDYSDNCACRCHLTPSADVPACRDEDPAQPGTLAACYPDPPDYQPDEEPPLEYTEADRAYDRDAFARDYGLRDE